MRRHRSVLGPSGLFAAAVALLYFGATHEPGPADAITVFDSFAAGARIEAKIDDLPAGDPRRGAAATIEPDEGFERCDRIVWAGYADCGRAGRVTGAMSGLIGHEVFSWPWAAPAIAVQPYTDGTRFRIAMRRRLAGTYEAAAYGERPLVRLTIDGDDPLPLTRGIRTIELGDTPREHMLTFDVVLSTKKPAFIGMLRPESVERKQEIPEPPNEPPPELAR